MFTNAGLSRGTGFSSFSELKSFDGIFSGVVCFGSSASSYQVKYGKVPT